jgi:hypothetical protein
MICELLNNFWRYRCFILSTGLFNKQASSQSPSAAAPPIALAKASAAYSAQPTMVIDVCSAFQTAPTVAG